jgi:hypothetical protein
MDAHTNDMINQITLNCLISKSQLMKINNTKLKKNLNIERKVKIKKYKTQLIKLFEDLLNKKESSNLFDDDVKSSYVQFIDKSIIYLDKQFENDTKEDTKEYDKEDTKEDTKEYDKEEDDKDDEILNKLHNMMDKCHDERYYELVVQEDEKYILEDINEDDEDDEEY